MTKKFWESGKKSVRVPNSSVKQCDLLSHARQAPFPFPLFLFPDWNWLLTIQRQGLNSLNLASMGSEKV